MDRGSLRMVWAVLLMQGCGLNDPKVSQLEAEVADLQTQMAELTARLEAMESTGTTPQPPTVSVVDTPLVLEVPAQYTTIQEAIDALDAIWFRGDGAATIQIANGEYTLTAPLSVRHPQGDRIHIVGGSPSGVVLTCRGVSCLELEGHALGSLDGVTLQYEELASGEGVDGVHIARGAKATLGPDLAITGFSGDCLEATEGSIVVASGTGMSFVACGAYGVYAAFGSYVDLSEAYIADAFSHGVRASYGAILNLSGTTVERSEGTGIYVSYGSVAQANPGAHANDNDGYGFECAWGSACNFAASTGSGNTNSDLHCVLLSAVELDPGYSFGATSPAVGVAGNEGCWISP